MKVLFQIFLSLFFLQINLSYATDLSKDHVRKLLPTKKSIYLQKGIFHTSFVSSQDNFTIKEMRHFFSKKEGHERVVFQFDSQQIPKIYGSISALEKKIYVDFFKTKTDNALNSIGKSKYVQSINFYPINKDSLSVEINLKESVGSEAFYLTAPGRFVIDLRPM